MADTKAFGQIRETPFEAECSARGRLKTLKAEKKRLEDELKKIDDSIHRTQAEYCFHRNRRLSRAANLPPEILAMIFVIAYTRRMELIVSHVCSRWRDAALETSFLWTNIQISDVSWRSDGLDEYVERSGTRNVDLTIGIYGEWEAIQQRIWKRLDSKNVLERCRALTVIAESDPEVSIYPALRHLKDRSMPVLESLSIEVEIPLGVDNTAGSSSRIILSGGAPRLRFLQIRGCSLRTPLPPLTGLTTAHLHRISLCNRDILTNNFNLFPKEFASLERLSLEGEPVNPMIITSKLPFPILRELRLRSYPEKWAFSMQWRRFIAPNLETLHLYDCNDEYLPKFPKLKHLIIESSEDEPYQPHNEEPSRWMLTRLCRLLPSVKHLTCINNLRSIYHELCDPNIWPRIESVRFCARPNQDMGLADLQDMLICRDKAGRPIPMLCVPNRPASFPGWILKNTVPSLNLKMINPPAQWPEWVEL